MQLSRRALLALASATTALSMMGVPALAQSKGTIGIAMPTQSSARWISDGNSMVEQFKAAVQVQDAIMECHMVAGGFDYLVKTRVADMEAYRQFAGTVLWQLPGVRETRTYAVMEEVKNSTRLHLG